MTKPAGKIVTLAELRFKPANSNDAARAVMAHHFAEVPHCSFARDDGISPYLGSETGMEQYPAAPDVTAPTDTDIPAIRGEAPETNGSLHRKLLRGGFALSVLLHAALAVVVGLATLSIPDDAPLEEGITSVTIVTQGTSDVEARLAGDKEEVEAPVDKPVETQPKKIEKPVEAVEKPVEKPVAAEKPVELETRPAAKKVEEIPRDVPLPMPGADLPEVLTSQDGRTETEAIAQPPAAEKKVEPVDKPVTPVMAEKSVEKKPEEQKPVEKQPEEKPKPIGKKQEEPKKDEPKKEEPKKEKPREKRRQNRGNQGNTSTNGTKGDVDAEDKGRASTSSKGASSNREIGNSARTNYKGLVNRKLSRAKGRLSAPAKGEVWVGFTILSDGSISGLAVTRSSGKAALDAIALKVVRNALPFPPIPAEAGRKSWKMTVPMTFRGG